MTAALWVGKTGLDAQQTRMSVVANNLANVSTTGFKRGRAAFEDLLYQNVRQVGGQTAQNAELPSGLSLGAGTRVVSTSKLFTQGNVIETGNNFDMAINGRGFFKVNMPDGTAAYTRDGSFQINKDGQLVTSSGYVLQPEITIPPGATSCTISRDGVVSVTLAGESEATQAGNLQLADFINPAGLQAVGENLYLQSGASGDPQEGDPANNGLGTIMQGYLETSNVNVVEEMVDMIETQRAYELNAKVISSTDQMMQHVNQQL